MVETTRHHEIFDPNAFHLPIHIVGCGGMGSHVATALVRMGIGKRTPLLLYDHDTYEPHNLANQAIDRETVGTQKVFGLAQQLSYINPEAEVLAIPEEIRGATVFEGVVFLCLDSMEARKDIMEWCIEGHREIKCVIETRMDAETGISHCFNPNNPQQMDCWWLYWYPDGHTEKTPGCGGYRSIVSAVLGTTAMALKQFEVFARKSTRDSVPNRVYSDFRYPNNTKAEYWSKQWHP